MLEPIALGELHLTIEQFGDCTVGQIDALVAGYLRRRDSLEDLLICYSALPQYQMHMKHAPSYRKLTAHRRTRGTNRQLDQDEVVRWKEILKEAKNVEIH